MDTDTLLNRIKAEFPRAALENAVINRDGMVNTAVIIGDDVFRFAHPESWAVESLKREIAVVNLLRDRISVQIPRFDVIAEDFVHYRFIPGEPLTRGILLTLPQSDSDRILEALASFLQVMHGFPVDQIADVGLGQSAGARTRDEWVRFYAAVERELFPLMYRVTRDHIRVHFAPVLENTEFLAHQPALIHDDLAQYHLLVDSAARRLNGVIDFGTAGLGDPAADYGILINVYGESVVSRMGIYDPRLESLIDRARFYAGTYELQWLLSGHRSQSWEIMTAHLDRARDSRPYGTRL